MIEQARKAAATIEGYKANSIIMNFVTTEAIAKVTEEMNSEGYTNTAKATELLMNRYSNIKDRVQEYINAGLIGVYMAEVAA